MLLNKFIDPNDFSNTETVIRNDFIERILPEVHDLPDSDKTKAEIKKIITSMIFDYRWKKIMVDHSFVDIYSIDISNFITRWKKFDALRGDLAYKQLHDRKLAQMTQITQQLLDPTYQIEADILHHLRQEKPQPHTIRMAMATIKTALKKQFKTRQVRDTLPEFLKEFLDYKTINFNEKYQGVSPSDLYRMLLENITSLHSGQYQTFQKLLGDLTHNEQIKHRTVKVSPQSRHHPKSMFGK